MRISREQALECLKSGDLIGMGMEADAVRRHLHPEGVATYALGCTLNYSPLASADADEAWCDAVCAEIADAMSEGAAAIRLTHHGSVKSGKKSLSRLEELLRGIRLRFAPLWIEGFTAAEIADVASSSGLTPADTIVRLRDAGLDAIAGDGPVSTDASAIAEWTEVHRAAHVLGMKTSAGMLFGAGETLEQRVDLLDAVRTLQEETGGFAAFAPVAAPAPKGRQLDSITAVERLKMLAVARMFLDNIENVQADGIANGIDGLKVLQIALRFGANDLGMIDVDARSSISPAALSGSEEDLRRIIRDAGLRPAERDAAWRAMMLS